MAGIMVPFVSWKGGVGRTALAVSYAAEQARQGATVMVADLNPDVRTATTWARVRDQNGITPRVPVEGMTAKRALELIGRYDVLVVDATSTTDKSTLALVKAASVVVVPTRSNPTFDLDSTIRLLHGLKREKIAGQQVAVVLNQLRADTKGLSEDEELAREYLGQAGYEAVNGVVPLDHALGMGLAEGYGMTEVTNTKAPQLAEIFATIHARASGKSKQRATETKLREQVR